eukprot:scaffold27545_cov76-Amphora_coffeaeformis.AAC.1
MMRQNLVGFLFKLIKFVEDDSAGRRAKPVVLYWMDNISHFKTISRAEFNQAQKQNGSVQTRCVSPFQQPSLHVESYETLAASTLEKLDVMNNETHITQSFCRPLLSMSAVQRPHIVDSVAFFSFGVAWKSGKSTC